MLERIGRYVLKERIGAGGQATAYLGEDMLLKRTVAVKVMTQLASVERGYIDAIMDMRLYWWLACPTTLRWSMDHILDKEPFSPLFEWTLQLLSFTTLAFVTIVARVVNPTVKPVHSLQRHY